jgi:hypothetical protein
MTTSEYLTSWLAFTQYIVSMFEGGETEADISEALSGSDVMWVGCISEMKIDEEYSPGVALNMEPAITGMTKGRKLRSDYLFLNIDDKTVQSWKGCKAGDRVRFKATIAKASGPFHEIQLSEDDEDPEVLLMVGLYDCKLIEAV